MKTGPNWSPNEDLLLRNSLRKGVSLKDIANSLDRSEDAVYLYCYRHRIALKPQIKKPMMVELLRIKFGRPELFTPDKEFFRRVGINQKRWSVLASGYAQATQTEIKNVALELKYTTEEAFELIENRQLDLFE